MRLARLLGTVAVVLLAAAASASGEAGPAASAQALAILAELPGAQPTALVAAAAPPAARAHAAPAVYPADGAITVTVADSDAHLGPGHGRSGARAVLHGVSIFGGEITVDSLEVDADAFLVDGRPQGSLAATAFSGLRILGQPIEPTPNERVPLGDWGYAVVLEQAVIRDGSDGAGYRGLVSGLHLYLTADHGGLPAGSELVVGYAEAALRSPEVAQESGGPQNGQPAGGENGGGSANEPTKKPPGAHSGPPPIVRNPPPGVKPAITGLGYVFPVYGQVSFSDDFGAPRADTGWHHGNDVFAPVGAPILAVAGGVVFSVGWNELGGNRLWLRDGQGNEYYYAHLSAYSPLATNGAHVHAGDVLGFVGDTGDARGTPYHLHFEIHPAALLGLGYDGVVNPYEYLLAWRHATDVRGDFSAGAPVGQAPAAAAVPLQAEDISTASGLVPGALERAVALPSLLTEAGGLSLPGGAAPLISALPGFVSLR